jgi:hypothetical protein
MQGKSPEKKQGATGGPMSISDRNPVQKRHSAFASTALQSTLPFEMDPEGSLPTESSRLSLSPSLLLDIQRFSEEPETVELLAVCAACMRHAKPLVLKVQLDGDPYDLALDPGRNVYHCAVDLSAVPDQIFVSLRLLQVQPGELSDSLRIGLRTGSLRPLLWHLALRGSMSDLLPEIAGAIRCRVALGTPLSGLPLDGSRKRLIDRMKFAPVSVDDLVSGSGLNRGAVQRVWNALYLQSALMITRQLRDA